MEKTYEINVLWSCFVLYGIIKHNDEECKTKQCETIENNNKKEEKSTLNGIFVLFSMFFIDIICVCHFHSQTGGIKNLFFIVYHEYIIQ